MMNFVAVSATGTCSSCTGTEIEREKDLKLGNPPKTVTCQIMKRSIGGSMCRSMSGQDGCRGCIAASRVCETCSERPVRFPQYGMCFTCSVKELGDGWEPEALDRSVAVHPHLRLVPPPQEETPRTDSTIQLFAEQFQRIPLANLKLPEQSIRTVYDDEELYFLGDSLVEDRMIYPIIVEPVSDNFYEVIIGTRRVRAALIREVMDIPALVVSPQSPLTKILMALAENVHRVNLDPFEEGRVFLRLMKDYSLDTNGVAVKSRRTPQYVKERLQLLSLPEDVQELVAKGQLAIRNAAALARLPEGKRQKELAKASVKHRYAPGELRRKITAEVGEIDNTNRVIPYRVTPEKFAASITEFSLWFDRVLPRIDLSGATPKDRLTMMTALAGLENKVRQAKESVRRGSYSKRKK